MSKMIFIRGGNEEEKEKENPYIYDHFKASP